MDLTTSTEQDLVVCSLVVPWFACARQVGVGPGEKGPGGGRECQLLVEARAWKKEEFRRLSREKPHCFDCCTVVGVRDCELLGEYEIFILLRF
jgi:hypothetical protein